MNKQVLIEMLQSAPDDVELLVRDSPIGETWSEAAIVYESYLGGARFYFYPPQSAPPPDVV